MSSLARGKIEASEGSLKGQPVEFMFNPTEYGISKRNTWTLRANKSGNVPQWEFGGGDPRELQVELFFDSYLPRKDGQGRQVKETDVRKATNQLFNMMMIDTKLKSDSPNSKMGAPPKCRITWGGDSKNQFDCYITSCSIKYLLFSQNGIPVRATATLALKEARDPKALLPTNPTSTGEPGRRVHVVQEGDRLDWIAYQEYGDARQWRRIAEANRIVNPLDLTVGMVLSIPT
jgi:hypothetical protein